MQTRARWAAHSILAGVILITSTGRATGQEEPLRILVIHQNADIGVWEQVFNEAFYRVVSEDPRVRVTLEFPQLLGPGDEEGPLLAESLRRRMAYLSTDLVIAAQPAAGRFLLEWGDTFAPDVPRLFVLPDPVVAAEVTASGGGVLLESAVSTAAVETAQLIPRLLPKLRHIYIVGGASSADSSYASRVVEAVEGAATGLTVSSILGVAPNAIIDSLNAAPPNSAVILATYDRDDVGRPYRTTDVITLLRDGVDLPVFGLFDSVLGRGVVGGSMTNAALYGLETGDLAERILSGRPSGPGAPSPTAYMFDARELERFGISRARLPAGSRIVNDVPPAWREHLAELLVGLGVILTQAVLIAALLKSLRRRRAAEKDRDRHWVGRENQVRLFESVVNTLTSALIIVDISETIVAGNESGFFATFGSPITEWIDAPIQRLLSADKPSDDADSFTASLRLEPSIRRFQRNDGTAFPGEYFGGEITDIQGRRTGYYALVRDVTERLEEEEEARQAHKMEALGSLAGGVAHDFNNILMAISGCAEVAAASLASPDEIGTQLSNILTASERGRQLVSQILTFSRRDNGEPAKRVDLGALLRESASLLDATLPKTVELSVSVPADLWCVEARPSQIQQIVMNLGSNSTYAMQEGGCLTIEAINVSVREPKRLLKDTLPPGGYVRLTVADTGIGIPAEALPRVLEPFFTTKPPGKGTGMGLASVYGIVGAHGAYLDITSEVGRGTAITVYLRPSQAAEARTPAPSPRAEAPLGEGETILLVDDESLVLRTTGRMLTHLGYEVVSFVEPLAALEAFRREPHRFDLVVSDRSMPDMDGAALLGEVARLRPGTPSILCTGFADLEDDHDRPFEILAKPCRLPELGAAVTRALQGRILAG